MWFCTEPIGTVGYPDKKKYLCGLVLNLELTAGIISTCARTGELSSSLGR
jgi:hypothetical protein